VQDGERDPEEREREDADEGAEEVGEDYAAGRRGAVGWAGDFLVQDFVEAVEHASDAYDEVSKKAVVSFAVVGSVRASGAAAGFTAVFRAAALVAVGYYQHAEDRDSYGDVLAPH